MPGGSSITLNDLTVHEKFILRLIAEEPEEKHIGLNLLAANNLASYGLAKYVGSMKFELTPEGNELYLERKIFFKNNPTENIKRAHYVGDPLRLPV